MVCAYHQKVVDTWISSAECRFECRARLPFMIDTPGPIDELREASLELDQRG
jgi:hypothetical protein